MNNSSDKLMDEFEFCRQVGISVGTARNWRCSRLAGPRFVKIGRLVRYRQSDIDEWIEEQVQGGNGAGEAAQ